MRVQIPAYTDRWMMGDRYGEIIGMAKAPGQKRSSSPEIAIVQLDKSGKVVRVRFDDCIEVAR
jgi:hypothetical protein